jgi:hypothetical protein
VFAQVTQPNFWEKNSPLSSHYAAAPCDNNNNRDCLIFYLTVYVCISISAYGLFLWSRINLDQSQLVSTRDLEWNLSCLVHEMISSHLDLKGCACKQISISPRGPRRERDAHLWIWALYSVFNKVAVLFSLWYSRITTMGKVEGTHSIGAMVVSAIFAENEFECWTASVLAPQTKAPVGHFGKRLNQTSGHVLQSRKSPFTNQTTQGNLQMWLRLCLHYRTKNPWCSLVFLLGVPWWGGPKERQGDTKETPRKEFRGVPSRSGGNVLGN